MPSSQKHSLLKCMKQPLFVTHNIWFCILTLKFFYFTGILNVYLNRNLDADKGKGELSFIQTDTIVVNYLKSHSHIQCTSTNTPVLILLDVK